MVKMGTVEDHTQAKGAHKLTLSNRRTAGTVSYTHLDVYKRQRHCFPEPSIPGFSMER